jgi:hypothetical protein
MPGMPTPAISSSPRPLPLPSAQLDPSAAPSSPSPSPSVPSLTVDRLRPLAGPTTHEASPSLERGREGARPALASPQTTAMVRFARGHAHAGAVGARAAGEAQAVTPASAARTAAVQAKLDRLQERYSGPYLVGGERVSARPMFRMGGGCNEAAAKAHIGELQAMCNRAHVTHVPDATIGRATPAQLVKITQVLIDNGKLPPGDAPIADRIKQMQWEWGIGLDCAGYAFQATLEVHGAGTLSEDLRNGHFQNRLAGFRRAAPEAARAGDVIHLANPEPKAPGHNVVVYSNKTLDPSDRAELTARFPSAAGFLAEPGPIVALEVDASWGAGEDGRLNGGVRRDTWLFNTRTGEWGDFDPTTRALTRSTVGPQGEAPTGSFRPYGVR